MRKIRSKVTGTRMTVSGNTDMGSEWVDQDAPEPKSGKDESKSDEGGKEAGHDSQ